MKSPQYLFIFMLLTLLSACQHQQRRPDGNMQRAEIGAEMDWSVEGKIAFSDGQDGGSGRFTWVVDAGQVMAELRAPLGQGTWRLQEASNGDAVLYEGRNEIGQRGPARLLVAQQIGWQVPWDSLKSWLRISPHHTALATVKEDADRLVIEEQGWVIEYHRWSEVSGRLLPSRMSARKPPYSIKLSIKRWDIPQWNSQSQR